MLVRVLLYAETVEYDDDEYEEKGIVDEVECLNGYHSV